jgi:hypothetical protein
MFCVSVPVTLLIISGSVNSVRIILIDTASSPFSVNFSTSYSVTAVPHLRGTGHNL